MIGPCRGPARLAGMPVDACGGFPPSFSRMLSSSILRLIWHLESRGACHCTLHDVVGTYDSLPTQIMPEEDGRGPSNPWSSLESLMRRALCIAL